ncbi:aldo/keto reductase [Methyloprofundus sedimenti]|uniref:Aldo/keto reductase n=1 Tax=Methyloprofundus sedimenti TaxID=1420851 RepID=A0A1V8M242_9GAMM|nr:aldo/keto reductase [Methyloprofundus sedimenti]OQK15627.1 aldo/keto reductase [Methyloprofundus sedimenti]
MIQNQHYLTTLADVNMPPLIYGTAWKKEHTAELVVQAIQAGFRGIDTACQPKHYNEPQVGAALQRVKGEGVERKSLFIQTKFTPLSGQDAKQIPYDRDVPLDLQVAQSFAVSKSNLQTDYVDSFVLHSPLAPHEQLMTAWQAMEKIQQTGAASQLGISNCYDLEVLKLLYNDAEVKPAIVQNRFYKNTNYDTELRRWCANQGIIYQSFWSLTANPGVLSSHNVQAIAQKYQKTAAQIFFRYLTYLGIVPLTGTTSITHMKEDLAIFEFELTPEDLSACGLFLKET